MRLPISLRDRKKKKVGTKALIDCGAQGDFIDKTFAEENGFPLLPLPRPIKAKNVDGTLNKKGTITHYTWVNAKLKEHRFRIRLLAVGLGKDHLILGMPWLKKTNPKIDWQKGTIRINDKKVKRTISSALRHHYDMKKLEKIEEEKATEENTTETKDEPNEDQDLVIAYLKNEPVIAIFQPKPETPVIRDHEPAKRRSFGMNRVSRSLRSMRFSFGKETWIRAKTSISQTLAHTHDSEKKNKTLEEMIPEKFLKYRSVFEKAASERFPESRPWDHAIDLKEDFVPRDCKIYSLTPEEQKKMDEFLDENLKKGYIRPSTSPMATPFFFTAKKDADALRPCQDYRLLNEGTVKNAYPLPLISELVDRLKGAKIFTKLDIRWGYNNVRIKKGDEWKAAFKTNRGLFEPTVMFFGLCNSPATFQAMMDHIFRDMIIEGWISIYMDDILIFSKDPREHEKRTLRVLQRLQENDLFLKPEKCKFDVQEVEFLGLIIHPDKISMDPTKLAGIKDWPTPTTVKGVRSFLGFGNFYRRFIGHYADIARPLNDLTKKDKKFEWIPECQKAFDTLKDKFAKEPVLLMPDTTKPFYIEADASKFASGAVLRQQDQNGDWHPCGFISHSFDATQRNYEIYDRELLAIIRALETWRHYLLGSQHPTTILSDHKNLTYFRTAQKLNRRQARWSLLLSQFNLKLVHVPGGQMIQSDALSRRPDLCPEEDNDNSDVTLLPDEIFVKTIDIETHDLLAAAMMKDETMKDAIQALKTGGTPPLKSSLTDWKIEDGLLFFKDRCYVPPDQTLRQNIVRKYHDGISMGHPGQFRTIELVRRDYWWPGMTTFINQYVKGCAVCQQMKVNTHPSAPPLMPITSHANRPFALVTTDFITDLPIVDGNDSIMVVVDHGLSKGVILIPCNKTIHALGSADLYLEHVYKRYGLPDIIISDRDPRFAAALFQELGKLLGIKLKMSTAYHPQTDGETERMNQEIEAYLRMFCTNNPEKWKTLLPTAEFAHNQQTHSVTKKSPFYLQMGYEPKAIPTAFFKTNIPAAETRLSELLEARKEALAAHELARQAMKERTMRNFKPFEKKQKVWLDSRNLKLHYETRKLAPRREGPFAISDVLGPLTYRLVLPSRWKIHPVFHATLLSPYHETDVHGPNFLQPPPDLIEGEPQYEVEAILSHRRRGKGHQYLIKWKGYSSADNSWEPENNLKNAPEILASYKKRRL